MVKYIKDGAYTIVVKDDGDSLESSTEGVEVRRSASRSFDDADDAKGADDDELTLDEEEDELLRVEDVDYKSTAFILQNLKIAKPTYEEDKTHTLEARRDLAIMMVHQVAFYVYCALQPYLREGVEQPSILVIGEGFMGSRLIHHLASFPGMKSMLRIYTRGEFAAQSWKDKGFIADHQLQRLSFSLGSACRAKILILSADYASFHFIYHQIARLHLLDDRTFLISTTLGFQRKKLLHNFSIPTILRTYLEPGIAINRYWGQAINETFSRILGDQTGKGFIEKPMLTPPLPAQILPRKANVMIGADGDHDDQMVYERAVSGLTIDIPDENSSIASVNNALTSIDSGTNMDPKQHSVLWMMARMRDVKAMLYVLENYYYLHDMPYDEARRTALRVLLDIEEQRNELPVRAVTPTNSVPLAVQALAADIGQIYQQEFKKYITSDEIQELLEEPQPDPSNEAERHDDDSVTAVERGLYNLQFFTQLFGGDDRYEGWHGAGFNIMRKLDIQDGISRAEARKSMVENAKKYTPTKSWKGLQG